LKKQFDILRQNRKLLRAISARIPEKLLFEQPEGFRNTLWWNFAHIISIQQTLMYTFSGLPARMDAGWIDTYKKGTIPGEIPSTEEIAQLPSRLVETAIWAVEDYENNLFKNYEEYTTSNKVTLSSVEDAINFNNFHEGLHLGVILSQMKVLGIPLA
jgi:hypothetical protein